MAFRRIASRPRLVAALLLAVLAAGACAYLWVARRDPGDPRLNAFVLARPPVPVVFTSRSDTSSFEAPAPEGEEYVYPGKRLWAAREGRLRLLTPRGTVHELTWGKPLPDGSTLIDVMSPSVSLDGKTVLFAGRKDGGAGHFRLYEVAIDGTGLRPLTGGPEDTGAVAVPPLRFQADRSTIPDPERRRIDYDDVDPIEVRGGPRQIVFASSRTPDLGRDHARRSTTLWLLDATGRMVPASANRNNDRWPFLLSSGYVGFSLWSRNREVISADETDIQPYNPSVPAATRPTDAWLGAFIRVSSSPHFGMLVKPPVLVWRLRPLFNGRLTFMTSLPQPDGSLGPLTVVQAEPGLIGSVPSARPTGVVLPAQQNAHLRQCPDHDAEGRRLWLATPSPCPPAGVLLAAASLDQSQNVPEPGRFGLFLARDDWPDQETPASANDVHLQPLFDDPEMVDAEPVAVYARKIQLPPVGTPPGQFATVDLSLAGGKTYRGPTGAVMMTTLYGSAMHDLPGQQTDAGAGPIFAPPPEGTIDRVKVYAARRDRFDDPITPRQPGKWELLMDLPARDTTGGSMPTDCPTVLAGFGKDGKVVRWTTAARDTKGRRAQFYAFAGDHYSLTSPGVRNFCVGCHPGHSGLPRTDHRHAEALGN